MNSPSPALTKASQPDIPSLTSNNHAAQPMLPNPTPSLTARLARWLLLAAVSLSVAQAEAARAGMSSVEKLYVFGDSLSDSGNSGVLSGGAFPAPPYFENRFSNGKVAVEYLWDILNPGNSTFTASLKGGSNYAVGGSSSGKVNSIEQAAYDNKGIAWQLTTFQSSQPQFNPNTSLFVVRVFPNDVFYYTNTNTSGLSVGTYAGGNGGPVPFSDLPTIGVNNILGTIQQLASSGAVNFLVVNSPDLSKAPAYLNTPEAPMMADVSQTFNALLQSEVSALASNNPQLNITLFDTNSLLNQVLANPAAFGFSNVTTACYANSIVCSDPSSSLYWDRLHPTTRGHALFAQGMAQALGVPGPLPILGSVTLFGWSRKLRRRVRCSQAPAA
jgi:phospholipase/lecithinase/hemolysin